MNLYTLVGLITLSGLFCCMSGVEGMRTLTNVVGKSGGSVTIPCLYEKQYKSNRKYWCKGLFWNICSKVAYGNTTGRTSVTDYPDQNMFIIQLDSLSVSDSGWYWCAAEIGNEWILDDHDSLFLMVSPDPAVSVLDSRVRAEEGGSVTIQCFYRAGYRNKQKLWCRAKNGKCYNVGNMKKSLNSQVQIIDDGKMSFTLQMNRLNRNHAGWYWCVVGNQEVPVHLSISDSHKGQPEQNTEVSQFNATNLVLWIIFGILLLLMVVGGVFWKLKKRQKGALVLNEARICSLQQVYDDPLTHKIEDDKSKHPAPGEEVTYSSVKITLNPKFSPVHNDRVIYSSVKHKQ